MIPKVLDLLRSVLIHISSAQRVKIPVRAAKKWSVLITLSREFLTYSLTTLYNQNKLSVSVYKEASKVQNAVHFTNFDKKVRIAFVFQIHFKRISKEVIQSKQFLTVILWLQNEWHYKIWRVFCTKQICTSKSYHSKKDTKREKSRIITWRLEPKGGLTSEGISIQVKYFRKYKPKDLKSPWLVVFWAAQNNIL